jgi:hypothetical protein
MVVPLKAESLALYLVTFTFKGKAYRVLERGNTAEEAYERFLEQLSDRAQDRSSYSYIGGYRWPRVQAAPVTDKKPSPAL